MVNGLKKRLYRSRQQRIIAGVCGGLGEYFNVDPTWIRLIFFLCFIFGFGASLLIYGILWLITSKTPINPTVITHNE